MRGIIEFIKTTAIGGFLVIVPIAVILFVMAQLFYGLYALAGDVTSTLGIEIDDALIMMMIAALVLVAICFVTGLVVQTQLGAALKRWFAAKVGRRIPMFNAISNIAKRFVGVEGTHFAPIEIDLYDSDARAIGFLIEALPDNRCAVFVPSAPVATVGNVLIVARNKVTPIEASMADAVTVITQWGVDARDLFGGDRMTGPDGDSKQGP